MLEALVAGTTDPEIFADLAKGKVRAKIPTLRTFGHWWYFPKHSPIA